MGRAGRARRAAEQATAGRQPDSAVTVTQLLDQYVSTAGWDLSTLLSNLGYIRRTIKPALGSTRVRGPLLDTLYSRLMRCGGVADFVALAVQADLAGAGGDREVLDLEA